jgi:hypothetical protein
MKPTITNFKFELFKKAHPRRVLWTGKTYASLPHKAFKEVPPVCIGTVDNQPINVYGMQANMARAFFEFQHAFHTTHAYQDNGLLHHADSPYSVRLVWTVRLAGKRHQFEMDYEQMKNSFKEWKEDILEFNEENIKNMTRYIQASKSRPNLNFKPKGSDLLLHVLQTSGVPVITHDQYDRLMAMAMEQIKPNVQEQQVIEEPQEVENEQPATV